MRYDCLHLASAELSPCCCYSFGQGSSLLWTDMLRPFNCHLFMVALCNRADHYIFMLFLLSSSFFPRLISAVRDWMFTILWHMVWP